MSEPEETEANYFAMCLLMPEKFLRADIAKLKKMELDEVAETLAKKYKVSVAIMTLRLGQIGVIAGG